MTQRLAPVAGTSDGARRARAAAATAVAATLAAVGCYLLFVRTADGQHLDQSALWRMNAGQGLSWKIAAGLSELTIGAAVLGLLACVGIALARRRYAHAVAAVVLVVGANVTTQLAKHVLLERPPFGYGTTNSLPSGHTTLATSLLLAGVLVLPSVSRSLLVSGGAAASTVVGLGTVIAGWHRPSDVVAAFAVCLAWAGLVSAGLLLWAGVSAGTHRGHLTAAAAGALGAVVLAVAYGVRPEADWRDLVVNAGVLLGIAVAAALTVAAAARVMPTGR